jgi:hypothetical protein
MGRSDSLLGDFRSFLGTHKKLLLLPLVVGLLWLAALLVIEAQNEVGGFTYVLS